MLLSAGANVDYALGNQGMTPLLLAARGLGMRDLPILQALLAAGADVNYADHHGRTALLYAVLKGKDEYVILASQRMPIVQALLEAGADLHAAPTDEHSHETGSTRRMSIREVARDAANFGFDEFYSPDYYKRWLEEFRTTEHWNRARDVAPYHQLAWGLALSEAGWPAQTWSPSNHDAFPLFFREQVQCVLLCLRRASPLPNDLVVAVLLPALAHATLWDAPVTRPPAPLPPAAAPSSGKKTSAGTRQWRLGYCDKMDRLNRELGRACTLNALTVP